MAVLWFWAALPEVAPLHDRRTTMTIQVRDWQGQEHPFAVGPKNRHWTPLEQIPDALKWAVIVAEDGQFYRHEGVDVQALKEAIRYDLQQKRLARGASTITQQLAKNLFLSREKSVQRKLRELVLARQLEQQLSKGRILELYLNVVELGPLVHGVGHGSRFYFGKPAAALSARESAFLAAMLPGPRLAYNPYRNLRKVEKRTDHILRLMHQRGELSQDEYRQALAQELNIAGLERKVSDFLDAGATPPPPLAEQAGELLPETPPGEESAPPAEADPRGEDAGAPEEATAADPEPPIIPASEE